MSQISCPAKKKQQTPATWLKRHNLRKHQKIHLQKSWLSSGKICQHLLQDNNFPRNLCITESCRRSHGVGRWLAFFLCVSTIRKAPQKFGVSNKKKGYTKYLKTSWNFECIHLNLPQESRKSRRQSVRPWVALSCWGWTFMSLWHGINVSANLNESTPRVTICWASQTACIPNDSLRPLSDWVLGGILNKTLRKRGCHSSRWNSPAFELSTSPVLIGRLCFSWVSPP